MTPAVRGHLYGSDEIGADNNDLFERSKMVSDNISEISISDMTSNIN